MERPSHLNVHASHPFTRRVIFLGLAISLPLTVLWGLTQNMTTHFIRFAGPIHLVPDRETIKPATPPPTPKMQPVKRVTAIDPVIKYDPDQKDDRITATLPRSDDKLQQPPATGVDRAPAGVMSTHTRPPYPLLAQRLGAEGKVTLRLTVLADGRVGQAEIVTSSGRSDLDDTARDWIIDHWTYKPALKDGQPAVGQTLASVVFSLRYEH